MSPFAGAIWLVMALMFSLLLPLNKCEPIVWDGSNFTVFGYLPEYRQTNFDYHGAFEQGLTHLIFFSLEVDERSGLPSALDRLPKRLDAVTARKAADANGGKLLLSFGGNARSNGFGKMVSTKKRRRRFLSSLNELLKQYSFDGVDYNWEYPQSAQEWENWGKLMKESKEILLGDRSKNVVTFTMYLDPNHFSIITKYKLLRHADFLHCMAYDARGQHSTIAFAEQGIKMAKQTLGADAMKWTLGLPFYGRNIHNGEPKAFYELQPAIVDESSDMVGSVFYNSARTLMAKISSAMRARVGGVMIWELGQDLQPFTRPQALMAAVHAGLDAARAQGRDDGDALARSGGDNHLSNEREF